MLVITTMMMAIWMLMLAMQDNSDVNATIQVHLRKTFDKYETASFYTDVVAFAPTRTPANVELAERAESGLEVMCDV